MLCNILYKNNENILSQLVEKVIQTKNLVSEELKKIDECLHKTVLFVVKKTHEIFMKYS